MSNLRVLFEYKSKNRLALFCSDAESNFLILLLEDNHPVDSFVTRDFLLAIGHAHTFLMRDLEVSEIEAMTSSSKLSVKVDVSIETLSPGAVRSTFSVREQFLFSKVFPSELDAEMMSESYSNALQGWRLSRRKKGVVVPTAWPLLHRQNETHRAEILQITSKTSGAVMGSVLQVRQLDGPLIYERLRLFPQAVIQGNTFVPLDPPRARIRLESDKVPCFGAPLMVTGGDPPDHRLPEDMSAIKYTYEYRLNKVHTVVLEEKGVPPGFFMVGVFVSDQYITRLKRDQNLGSFSYTLPQAIRKAQDLLVKLQDWSI